jgi:hypothetical protein
MLSKDWIEEPNKKVIVKRKKKGKKLLSEGG